MGNFDELEKLIPEVQKRWEEGNEYLEKEFEGVII